MSHPRDEWVEFHAMGSAEPLLLLAVDGREREIAEAKAAYVAGRISADHLEIRIGSALGLPVDRNRDECRPASASAHS